MELLFPRNDYPNSDNFPEVSFPQEVTLPDVEPDVDTILVQYNPAWSKVLAAACDQLTQFSTWTGTDDEKKLAVNRAEILKILLQIPVELEAMGCCYDNVQRRLNSFGGSEISVNGGEWIADPNDPRNSIPTIPPITLDDTHTKCDAAVNALDNLKEIVTKYANSLENGADVSELASVILSILFIGLSVTLIGALISPLLLLIASSLLRLTRAGFEAYFTTTVWNQVRCALYCSIGDDGTFNNLQFGQLIGRLNSTMDAGDGKSIFINSLAAAGVVQLNNWSASGDSSSADCSDCTDCVTFCDYSAWVLGPDGGVIIAQDANHMDVQAVIHGGVWFVDVRSDDVDSCCCNIAIEVIAGTIDGVTTWWNPCGFDFLTDDSLNFGTPSSTQQINRRGIKATDAPDGFTVRIYSIGDCP